MGLTLKGISSLLFIIALEALCREIKPEFPEHLLYVDDLTLVSETLEGQKGILETSKGALESKGLRVNVELTKTIISSENDGKNTVKEKFLCAASRKGAGSNSILCQFCRYWVNKK